MRSTFKRATGAAFAPASLPQGFAERLQALANEHLGIEIRPGKELLVSLRAARHMRELGIGDADEYLRTVARDGAALAGLLDLLTTNHTAFLREPAHFDYLMSGVLAGWNTHGRDRGRIWCAAAATGQEPYTIAMAVEETLGAERAAAVRILATDVSRRALAIAARGIYQDEQVEPLPETWRRKYLLRGQGRAAGWWQVRPELRGRIAFRRLNLVGTLPRVGPFPVLFCRNVMIYFDAPRRALLLAQLAARLEVGGHLFVGQAESLTGADWKAAGLAGWWEGEMQYVQPGVYRKAGVGSGARQRGAGDPR